MKHYTADAVPADLYWIAIVAIHSIYLVPLDYFFYYSGPQKFACKKLKFARRYCKSFQEF